MDLVSLIVPIYNMENYIDRCFECLIHQDYSNYEIILVDDGSTDMSAKKCDEYKKLYPNKVMVIHKKNGGLSSARNEGMKYASGKYVIFPDPDDWVELNYVSQAMSLYSKHAVDLVCIGYFIDYDDHHVLANISTNEMTMDSNKAIESLLSNASIQGFAWNKFYKKEIIDQYDLKFLDDVGTTEDLDFAYRYLKHCKSVYYNPNIRTYHYYQRDGAATNSGFSIKKINSMNTYKKIISDKNNTKLTKKLAQSELCNLSINLILMYKNNNLSNPEILAHLKRTLKDNLGSLLTSHHSMSRKLQGIITCICPNILVKLKNIKHGG